MNESLFRSRTLAWVIVLGALSMLAAVLLFTFRDEISYRGSWANDSFSKSAVGHRAFVELMRRTDIPVVVSRHSSGLKAGQSATLLLLEPHLGSTTGPQAEALSQIWSQAWTILIVLPKWTGHPEMSRRQWLAAAHRVPPWMVDSLLAAIDLDARLVRPDTNVSLAWTENHLGVTPTVQHPQLLRSEALDPLCACEEGILVGEWSVVGDRLVVLSDPDVLANHGLGEGENAAFALRLIQELREGRGAVIVDETLHGYRTAPTILRRFFDFPLVLVLFQVLLTGTALLWIATRRFGAPSPSRSDLRPGKGFLIENTAELLHSGGHDAHILDRYVRVAIQDVARRLHIPPARSFAELCDRLQHLSNLRRISVDLHALLAATRELAGAGRPQPSHVLEIAGRIHRWRKEMIHEP